MLVCASRDSVYKAVSETLGPGALSHKPQERATVSTGWWLGDMAKGWLLERYRAAHSTVKGKRAEVKEPGVESWPCVILGHSLKLSEPLFSTVLAR